MEPLLFDAYFEWASTNRISTRYRIEPSTISRYILIFGCGCFASNYIYVHFFFWCIIQNIVECVCECGWKRMLYIQKVGKKSIENIYRCGYAKYKLLVKDLEKSSGANQKVKWLWLPIYRSNWKNVPQMRERAWDRTWMR